MAAFSISAFFAELLFKGGRAEETDQHNYCEENEVEENGEREFSGCLCGVVRCDTVSVDCIIDVYHKSRQIVGIVLAAGRICIVNDTADTLVFACQLSHSFSPFAFYTTD